MTESSASRTDSRLALSERSVTPYISSQKCISQHGVQILQPTPSPGEFLSIQYQGPSPQVQGLSTDKRQVAMESGQGKRGLCRHEPYKACRRKQTSSGMEPGPSEKYPGSVRLSVASDWPGRTKTHSGPHRPTMSHGSPPQCHASHDCRSEKPLRHKDHATQVHGACQSSPARNRGSMVPNHK